MSLDTHLARDRVLPLFTPDELHTARSRLASLRAAGLGAVELTARTPEVLAHFRTLRAGFPDLLFGAGTVLRAADAHALLDAGAGTVRERVEARDAGCGIVKLFPGEVLGPAFVRALLGPFPDARVIVTGGVEPTREGVAAWLGAGALAVGLGSRLFADPAGLDARLRAVLGSAPVAAP